MFDSFTKIGSSHHICQDYTLHNQDKAILTDGCSSVPYADVGARLVAHSAFNRKDHIWSMFDNATDVLYDMDLPPKSLCCTLGILDKDKDNLYIRLFGDGCICVKTKTDFNIFKVTYPQAAYYPIYDYFSQAKEEYIAEFGKPIVTVEGLDSCFQLEITGKYQCSFYSGLSLDEIEYVLMFSDGIFSFKEDYYINIIKELTEFKSLQGEFLRRRLTYLFKHEWKDLVHTDDLGIVGYTNV